MIQTQPLILEKSLSERLIGNISGLEDGPTFIFFGGIHGNEPAGILALEKVFQELKRMDLPIRGQLYGIRGNLKGLSAKKRFIDHDLNRLWTNDKIPKIKAKHASEISIEEQELLEIYDLVSEILKVHQPPLLFCGYPHHLEQDGPLYYN